MTTTQDVSNRIDAAIERIRAIGGAAGGSGEVFEKVANLKQANRSLQSQLEEIKAQRDADIAEIDALVAQLKPLIGEA